jgi:type IV pilus assembly protein PilY1
MNATLNKWIARTLVLTLINPAMFIQPAFARDTAVYSGFLATASTTVKPNILFLLDTSDSMNLPEAWREYEGAYDSHVEYLWNDLDRIVDADSNSSGEITAADDNKISTAAISGTFFTKWGFWQGATLAERQALWQAARASAKATQTGDPGAAYLYRKYDDLSWIYWLPAGVAETDARLRSPSWNKFRGYIQELGNGQGGSQLRGGPTYFDTNDFKAYNQCGSSLDALTPSTVFVPSSANKNSGKYLGQQWARWDPYLATTAVGVASYPGNSTQVAALGGATLYPKGYLDTTSASTGNPATNPVYRDSYPGTAPLGASGLPIRYNSGSAGSGWDSVKADAGGFILRSIIDGYATRTDLEQVMSWYGLPSSSDVDSSGTTTIADTKFIAWKGNRDGTPAFGSATGVPAYYDTTASICNSATGPASATCLDKPSGVTTPDFTLTKTATCNLTGTTSETDGSGNVRRRGGTCTIGTISNSGTDTNGASTYPSFTDVPAPTVCPAPTTANSNIRSADYSNCTRTSTTVTAATTCALTGNQTLTIGACAPSGGSTVAVASCAWSGRSTDTVAACAWSGRQTKTVGTCAWSGRTAAYTEGVGWFASGGSCQEGGSTTYCSGAAGSSGPYATQSAALAATAGCSNSVAAGSYQYGGTCTESGSPLECSISGGTSVLGAGFTNVNASCGNSGSPPAGNYNYGGTCSENGSTSSCQITGGTTRDIRGTSRLYGQTCSNKANSGTTRNASGNYTYNQTCTGTNNTCSASGTASIIVRGTTYNQVTSCTSTRTAGTYNRGGTCSGTNVPCAQVTPYGGTSVVIAPNTWYSTVATCTTPTAAQSYFSNCTGTQKVMPAVPPGGNAVTTNNTQAACSFTTNTVTINGNNYTNYATCTDKTDTDTTCTGRYGTNCQTACGAATPTSVTGGATSASHNYYRTYNFQDKTDYLVHDCKADDSGTKFMHYVTGTLGSFGNPWSDTNSYASSSTGGVTADSTKNVDMYSVNYLNWKFGPKGPNGHPIGRKTRLQIAKDVLADVISGFAKSNPADVKLRVGLMAFNQLEKDIPSGATSGNSSGAHLVKAVKDLSTTHGNSLIASVNALSASSATPLTESLYESYLYFKGGVPVFGGTTYQAKEAANSTVANPRYVTEGLDTSTDALSGLTYKSPIIETCQANVVILVSDGAPENDTSANASILALPDSGSYSVTQGTTSGQFEASAGVPFGPADTKGPPVGNNYVLLDELSYYMANVDIRSDLAGDQLVKLSTVSFGVDAPVLDKAAQTGGGNAYAASNAATLKDALEKAILAISQWQPQGSTPAITYNVSNGASGDIYVSAFSPSSNVTWPGTIKKYRFGFGESECGDASCGNPNVCMTGNPAVTYGSCQKNVEYVDTDITLKDENGDALQLRKIRSEAVSYWIPVTPADGGSGNKGGTGQVLIANGAPDSRNLFTFFTGSSTSATLSHVDNRIASANTAITKTLLGNASMTDAERNQLIGFAQGSDGLALSTWRPWPHFDSVHSTPLVDGQTLYYLTSDGVVHAVNTENGLERWAFMVEEGLPQIANTKSNQVGDHLEVADGSPVQATLVDGKKLLIFGMRRGGRGYYALDITNENSPLFAWKITPTNICSGTTCSGSASYAELGQAWSTPVVGYVRGYTDPGATAATSDDKLKPVLVFGGGYDTNQDSAGAGADSMGRAIFVADAADGSLINKFSTMVGAQGYSVPSDVLAIDTTGDAAGTLDRVYVGDMGGRLWRMDLDDRTATNAPSNWTIVRLADLRTTTRPIKLFNRPTMAPSIYMGQGFDGVFIGGGDTQQPTAIGTNDSGAFFMVKDLTVTGVAVQAASVPSAQSSSDFVDMTNKTSATTLDEVTSASAPGSTRAQDLKAASGWVINLADGEKVTTSATVLSGYLYFSAYLPTQTPASSSATQCSLGGYHKNYLMDALSSTPVRDVSGNLVNNNGNGRVFSFGLGLGGAGSLLGGGIGKGIFTGGPGKPAQGITSSGVRVFWYSVPER